MIDKIFRMPYTQKDNLIILESNKIDFTQKQTNDVFSEKWENYDSVEEQDNYHKMQKRWYLELYGFKTEKKLQEFLQTKKVIFDAGCGLGDKTKWFSQLSPNSIVIGMDFSNACIIAAEKYKDTENLFFIKGDIANLPFKSGIIDYVNCDQVIMHTQNPELTFKELTRVLNKDGEFACYVYAKKALPRELLDDFFRKEVLNVSKEELWELSEQLTKLGKVLSELGVKVDIPEIPLLGIKGGEQDLQRFFYWNFLKCYWNEEQGFETSKMINFDWYSPSNAKRYSEDEYKQLIKSNLLNISFFHKEEACYSGRFYK